MKLKVLYKVYILILIYSLLSHELSSLTCLKGETKEVEISKEDKLENFVTLAAKAFGLEEALTAGNLRLRDYNTHYELPGKVFASNSTEKIDNCRFYTAKNFVIETKSDSETFTQVYILF